MSFENEIKNIEAKNTSMKKEAFKRWMNQPEVRVLISMIPEGEKPGLVEMVLEAAHSAGWGGGSVASIIQVLNRAPR